MILEKLISILTRENITLALSIFGSIGTLCITIHRIIFNRKNVNTRIVGHNFANGNSLLLYISFENKSRLPISITYISVLINETWYSCVAYPVIALEETNRVGGKIISHYEYKTLSFPVNLSALGGTSGYVFFEFPEAFFQTEPTHMNFSISSTRGIVLKKKLSLGDPLD